MAETVKPGKNLPPLTRTPIISDKPPAAIPHNGPKKKPVNNIGNSSNPILIIGVLKLNIFSKRRNNASVKI